MFMAETGTSESLQWFFVGARAKLRPLIPKHNALLMANHGAVCYGEDVFQAYFRMETVEHSARIQFVAEMLGGPNVLSRREVDKLLDSRTRYGVKAAPAGEPSCPVVAEELRRRFEAAYWCEELSTYALALDG